MPDQKLPETPRPKDGGNARITDYFKSIERTDNDKKSKRELEDQEDAQPAKRLKNRDNGHTDSSKMIRYNNDVNTPKRKRKTPTSARLLDDTDGGLRESLVGRWDLVGEESVDHNNAGDAKHPKLPAPIHTPARVNNPRRKRPASSRLLDDTDGGLMDSLAGRFETPRHGEEASGDEEEKRKDSSTRDTVDDDSEAETIKAYDSEDGMSSDENRDDDDNEEDGGDGEDSEGNDSDKENVDPRDGYRTPSLPPLPATLGHHGNQSHETGDATPSNQASDSPSSFLLPSPVVDLPPLPSSPSSSTLTSENPSTLPSPPSSQ